MNLNVVRTLTMRAKAEGVPETTAAMKRLQTSHDDVTAAVMKNDRQMQQALKTQQDFARANQALIAANDNLANAFGAFAGQLTVVSRQGRELTDVFLRPMKNVVLDNVIAWALWRAGLSATLPELSKFSGSLLTNNIQLERLGLKGGQITGMLKKMGDDFVQIQPPMKQSISLTGQFSAVTGTLANQFGALAPQVAQVSSAMMLMGAGGILGAVILAFTAAAAAGKKFAESMIETGQSADFANISLIEFQRLQKALEMSGGLSSKSFASGTEAIAKNLFDAGRESNALDKLLKANNVEFEKGGKVTLGTVDAIKVMADLIKNATDGAQKLRVASAFGASKEWVRAVEDGGDAIQSLIDKMPKVGSSIDSEMIQKAKEFDRQWNIAMDTTLTALKAWALEAGKLLNLKVKIDLPTQDQKDFEDIGRAFTLMLNPAEFAKSNDEMGQILGRLANSSVAVFKGMATSITEQWEVMFGDKDGKIKAAMAARVEETRRMASDINAIFDAKFNFDTAGSGGPLRKETKDSPKADPVKDALDRQADSIKKHTATMIADTAAVGMGVQAQEQYRVKAQLLEAQIRADINTIKLSTLSKADQAKAIDEIAEKAGQAALGLAKMKLESDIKFTGDTLFLSDTEKQIASILRHVHGDGWKNMMDGPEAGALRLQARLKEVNEQFASVASGFAKDVANGVKPMDALLSAATKIRDVFIDLAAKKLVAAGLSMALDVGGDALGAGASATILISAGATLQAQMVAGATTAAGLLTAGGAAAGAAEGTGGAVGGTAMATGGVVAATAIATALGPLLLLTAGITAGVMFWQAANKKKEEEEKARAEWLAMADDFNAFLARASGAAVSSLKQATDAAYKEYEKLAVAADRAKDRASVLVLQQAYNDIHWNMVNEFVDQYGSMLSAMESGLGPESPFVQATANIKELAEQAKIFIADTAFVGFDTTDATNAAAHFLLSQIGEPENLSEWGAALATIEGESEAVTDALISMGVSLADTTASVRSYEEAARSALESNFIGDLKARINETSGRDWVNDFADLLDEWDVLWDDARSLGVDTQITTDWFVGQAQDLVNGLGLTGTAFNDLLAVFPELTGWVTQATGAIVRSASELESASQSIQDRIFALQIDTETYEGALDALQRNQQREILDETRAGGALLVDLSFLHNLEMLELQEEFNRQSIEQEEQRIDALRAAGQNILDYLNDLRAGSDSPLSPSARLAAAQQTYNATLALAQNNNIDALGRITQDHASLIDAARDFYGSGTGFQSIFNTTQTQLTGLPAVQGSNDPVVAVLENINESIAGPGGTTDEISSQDVFFEAMQAYLRGVGNWSSAMVQTLGLLNNSLGNVITATNSVAALVDYWGGQNVYWLSWLYGELQGIRRQAGGTPTSGDVAPVQYYDEFGGSLTYDQWRQVSSQFGVVYADEADSWDAVTGLFSRLGGPIGYAHGGAVANGRYDIDSVLARHANGSMIGLAGGEYVTTAQGVNANTRGMLEYINKYHDLPSWGGAANDNGGQNICAEIKALHSTIGSLLTRIADYESRNVMATERGTQAMVMDAEEGRRQGRINRRKRAA